MDWTGSDARPDELLVRFDGWLRRLPLGSAPLVLGRSGGCDLPLPDPSLSRRHLRLAPAGGAWIAEDLGSRAGSFLDGNRLEAPTALQAGQCLQIGSTLVQLLPAGLSMLSGDPLRDARNVELLLRTAGDFHGIEEAGELLRTIVDRAILIAAGDRGALLVTCAGGELEAAVARDAERKDLSPEQALTRTLPDRALQTGRAVVLTDAAAPDQKEAPPESLVREGLRSIVCVPLPGPAGERAGVLYVDSGRAAEDFGPADLALLEALAAQGSLALERARLRAERADRDAEKARRLEAENAALRSRLEGSRPIGEAPAMRQALELVRRFAASDATVCLMGETGTGKEVVARHLHQLGLRAACPFVVIDCGAIPEGLIESELFGHEQGAFTGAGVARKGLFREAERGTVLLDEIGELPMSLQTRLLRVLQEHTVQPVGSTRRIPVDVRVLCATHRDLAQRVKDGKFREDLYYRISLMTVAIPPLRQRGDDVLLLARHFLARFAAASGIALSGFTREALEALLAHSWPGNVRELERRVQRAVLLASPPFVTRGDLGLDAEGDAPPAATLGLETAFQPLQAARATASERFERAYLEEALQRAGGNVTRAAALAGVSPQLLRRLLRRHGIDRRSYRTSAPKPGA